MKPYESLFKTHREQSIETVFAHFYPIMIDGAKDYDEPFRVVARQTIDGIGSWAFQQERFRNKYQTSVPKLKNYLNYTFKRLLEIERSCPGKYFVRSDDADWIAFNTGLQNQHANDLLAAFQKYKPRADVPLERRVPDWVFKGCFTPTDRVYRSHFGNKVPDISWYSLDSNDFIFDVSYNLERDVFDHLFERAKERAGLPGQSDEVVRNYLRGALENLIPKIRRNYKIAIPVYYVEEKRMQLLLPFSAAGNSNDMSAFLIERDDATKTYCLKTIFDLDQAYFSARLITRPDKDWLNP